MSALHAGLLIAVLGNAGIAAEHLKSGPPIGEELPGTFEPVNITGPDAGDKSCIFCEYEARPVVLVFARDTSERLTILLRRLNAATDKHQAARLASSIIWLTTDADLPKRVRAIAEKERIQHTTLRTYKPEGPKGYSVAKEADITVILFTDRVVKARHAFRKGELSDKEIDAVLADIAKILPGK
jgi:hypothetical protein